MIPYILRSSFHSSLAISISLSPHFHKAIKLGLIFLRQKSFCATFIAASISNAVMFFVLLAYRTIGYCSILYVPTKTITPRISVFSAKTANGHLLPRTTLPIPRRAPMANKRHLSDIRAIQALKTSFLPERASA